VTATPTEPQNVVVIDGDDSVADARDALADARAGVALVFQSRRIIGVVTARDLDCADDDHTPVAGIMTKELVEIDPFADDLHTLRVYNNAAWQSLRRRHGGRKRWSRTA
jgi:CBS domain-containing protein